MRKNILYYKYSGIRMKISELEEEFEKMNVEIVMKHEHKEVMTMKDMEE